MKRLIPILLIVCTLALLPCTSKAATHKHYAYQGGHYANGHGSSHKGGHYKNPRTGDHYTHH